MNKKGGAPVFWISVFLVLSAILVFLVLVGGEGNIDKSAKGTWQMNFLRYNFLEAEKDRLENEKIAVKVGKEIAYQLAQNAGFNPGETSPCGEMNGINLWNLKEKSCPPDVEMSVASLGKKKLLKEISTIAFKNIGATGSIFYAEGGKRKKITKLAQYTYDTSFAVDVGYSFEEYGLLRFQAHELILNCRNEQDLEKCLDENKDIWMYSSCDTESFSESSRKVSFCVESPGNYQIPVKKGDKIEWKPIRYNIALDFTEITSTLQ